MGESLQASTVNVARHFKWTLDKLFFEKDYSHVVVLEDDLLVAHDFLAYFFHTADILDVDGRYVVGSILFMAVVAAASCIRCG